MPAKKENPLDSLLEEIHENAGSDREQLVKVRDKVVEGMNIGDPLLRTATAETVSRLSDSLVRVNSQLLEVAKIRLKEKVARERLEAGQEDDPDSLFDEIGDGFEREEDTGTN